MHCLTATRTIAAPDHRARGDANRSGMRSCITARASAAAATNCSLEPTSPPKAACGMRQRAGRCWTAGTKSHRHLRLARQDRAMDVQRALVVMPRRDYAPSPRSTASSRRRPATAFALIDPACSTAAAFAAARVFGHRPPRSLVLARADGYAQGHHQRRRHRWPAAVSPRGVCRGISSRALHWSATTAR